MGYLKNELSSESKYYLPKHRYLELKHFCLQYHEWESMLRLLDGSPPASRIIFQGTESGRSDETERIGMLRAQYSQKIELVEKAAREADPDLASYILLGVTGERTYPQIKALYDIPCGKNMYYDRYRRFFWLLDKIRE